MRFSPISEEEAKEKANGFLLKPGECDYEVRSAEEQTSSSGNPMIKLALDVWDGNGKKATVFDYLLEAMPHKVRHFAYSCGLGHVYEEGEMDAEQCEGKTGRLIIRTKPARDGYEAKNDVADYVIADSTKQTGGYQQAKKRDAGEPQQSNRQKAWKAFCGRTSAIDGERRNALWRECIAQVLGHNDQSKISDEEWHKVFVGASRYDLVGGVPAPLRHRETAGSPFEDAPPQFKEDDIPF